MAVAEFAKIRSIVRRESLDRRGIRWTDDELDKYINIAQETYVRRTGVLVSEIDIFHDGINFIYQTPEDFIEPKEFIVNNDNKKTIPITSWKKLNELYGPKFVTDENEEPYNICFDYESWNTFILYPRQNRPQGTFLGTLKYVRKPVVDKLEINNEETLAYFVLFRIYFKERNSKYLQKASKYKGLFERIFHKLKSRVTGSITSKAAYRSGNFY